MKFLGSAQSTQGTFLRPPSHVRRRRPNNTAENFGQEPVRPQAEPLPPPATPSSLDSLEKLRTYPVPLFRYLACL